MIFKRKLRKNMKKKMIISTCFALALLIGFLLGKCNSYVMNTSINGSYTEKELQSEKGPFQLELMDNKYQYYDPGTNENGEGSYEILDDGVIHFTSGDFEDSIAVSKKKFLYDPSLTIYNLSKEKKLELVKFKGKTALKEK